MPAILELVSPGGSRHYGVATALTTETVTLDLGERQVILPLSEVEPFWAGAFISSGSRPRFEPSRSLQGRGAEMSSG